MTYDKFMGFFQKGLSSFKIQTKFKCSLLPEFLIQVMFRINFFPKGKLFLLNLSITLQSLEIFGALEVAFSFGASLD
jgi:hypothetical protein